MKVNDSSFLARYENFMKASGRGIKYGKLASEGADVYETGFSESMSTRSGSSGNDLKNIVADMLARQGFTIQEVKDAGGDLKVDDIARKRAEEMLAPGGAWSPDAVSSRIVDFAISAFGNDKDKVEEIGDAINRGFAEASKLWGGELPDITKETNKNIFEKLELWVQGEYQV